MLLANREGIEALIKDLAAIPGCSTLEKYLQDLELRDGGQGNGYALLKDGRVTCMEKGVDLRVGEVAAVMEAADYDWVLFHTREASTGSVSDANCHPFRASGKAELVAGVNGNEKDLAALAKAAGGITDSEFIIRLVAEMGLPLRETLSIYESNFFGFYNGMPFVKKGNRDMLAWKKGNGLVFASDFPFGMTGLEKPGQDYFWMEENGEKHP
jgi:glutamine phosphoribosylpyrophosphate amidotransferase